MINTVSSSSSHDADQGLVFSAETDHSKHFGSRMHTFWAPSLIHTGNTMMQRLLSIIMHTATTGLPACAVQTHCELEA